MRKIGWLLAAAGGAALVSAATIQAVAASAGSGPATVLKFSAMTPVTGPYVGTANPIRGEPGGGSDATLLHPRQEFVFATRQQT